MEADIRRSFADLLVKVLICSRCFIKTYLVFAFLRIALFFGPSACLTLFILPGSIRICWVFIGRAKKRGKGNPRQDTASGQQKRNADFFSCSPAPPKNQTLGLRVFAGALRFAVHFFSSCFSLFGFDSFGVRG